MGRPKIDWKSIAETKGYLNEREMFLDLRAKYPSKYSMCRNEFSSFNRSTVLAALNKTVPELVDKSKAFFTNEKINGNGSGRTIKKAAEELGYRSVEHLLLDLSCSCPSIKKISQKINISHSVVHTHLKKYGIKVNKSGQWKRKGFSDTSIPFDPTGWEFDEDFSPCKNCPHCDCDKDPVDRYGESPCKNCKAPQYWHDNIFIPTHSGVKLK